MCDEDTSYTERAKSWLKEHEPTSDQIQDAYSKMLALLAKKPEISNGDTDECLELLVSAYGHAGGSVDDLLSSIEAKKEAAVAGAQGGEGGDELDYGRLYEVADAPAIVLPPSEKRAEFLRLKEQLGKKNRLPDAIHSAPSAAPVANRGHVEPR
ncbi:hypothetical protein [Pseudomonas sp. MWU12-2323]|uniref:hypothetical protein n=1 Tax=Pseudomonas sp. MWU12-2323 TaxID=2651296 RepID=UPI00128C561E|nr:hypothetical protein [Pseudomonas sp. MWU12-2323]MPQ69250.1 hypothetical protein [Pseudomonas sp. MWU12-2323]